MKAVGTVDVELIAVELVGRTAVVVEIVVELNRVVAASTTKFRQIQVY